MEVGGVCWWWGGRKGKGREEGRSGRNGRGGGGRCAVVDGMWLGLEDIEEASERGKRAKRAETQPQQALRQQKCPLVKLPSKTP